MNHQVNNVPVSNKVQKVQSERSGKTFPSLCTEPPSAPRNDPLIPQTNCITVRWSAPADLGGRRDLYYQVNRSDHEDPTSYTFTDIVNGTNYTFCGLRPHTQYCVRVASHNGVSDQDPDGEHLRTVEECTRTLETRKYTTLSVSLAHTPSLSPRGLTARRPTYARA